MNISSLSLKELQDLSAKIEEAKPIARRAARDQVRTKVMALAVENGFTLRELVDGRSLKSPVQPKYRDPKTGLTWSGRGRAPRWLKGSREQYAV